jgi:hypothetical protein
MRRSREEERGARKGEGREEIFITQRYEKKFKMWKAEDEKKEGGKEEKGRKLKVCKFMT